MFDTLRNDLVSELRSVLVSDLFVEIPEAQIGVDDRLRTVVGLDSVGFVELRVRCEQRFNVEIGDDDYTPENFSSIRRLALLIDRLQLGQTNVPMNEATEHRSVACSQRAVPEAGQA